MIDDAFFHGHGVIIRERLSQRGAGLRYLARPMLRQLHLSNFKCFNSHPVPFDQTTVLVGKNNAGKSTIVEALHLVAAVVNRKAASFVPPPRWAELPRFQMGIAPSVAHLDLDLSKVFHRYGEPPAVITAGWRRASQLCDSPTCFDAHRHGQHLCHRVPSVAGSGFLACHTPGCLDSCFQDGAVPRREDSHRIPGVEKGNAKAGKVLDIARDEGDVVF